MPTNAEDLHTFLRTRRSIRRFRPDPVPDEVIARILETAAHAPSAHNLQPWRFVIIPKNQSAEINEKSASSAKSAEDQKNKSAESAKSAEDKKNKSAESAKSADKRFLLARALTSSLRTDMTSSGAPESEIQKRIDTSLRRIDEAPVLILLCRDRTAVRADTPEEHTMSIQSAAAAGTVLLLAAHAEGLGANWICWPLYAQEQTRQALNLPESWEPQAMYFLGYTAEAPKEKIVKPQEQVVHKI